MNNKYIVLKKIMMSICLIGVIGMSGRGLIYAKEILPTQKDIIYKTVDGQALMLDIYLPTESKGKKIPVIIFYHGGSFCSGSKEDVISANYRDTTQAFLDAGYAVVSVNYRLCGPNTKFPDNYEDAKDAIRWVYQNAGQYNFDTNNIGLWGASAGGNIAMMVAYTDKCIFKGDEELYKYDSDVQYVINQYGPTKLSEWMNGDEIEKTKGMLELYFKIDGEKLESNPDQVIKIVDQYSPIAYVNEDTVPTLTLHGTADNVVEISQAYLLDEAFRKNNNEGHELVVFEGKGHDLKPNNQEEKDYQIGLILDFAKANYQP